MERKKEQEEADIILYPEKPFKNEWKIKNILRWKKRSKREKTKKESNGFLNF